MLLVLCSLNKVVSLFEEYGLSLLVFINNFGFNLVSSLETKEWNTNVNISAVR